MLLQKSTRNAVRVEATLPGISSMAVAEAPEGTETTTGNADLMASRSAIGESLSRRTGAAKGLSSLASPSRPHF